MKRVRCQCVLWGLSFVLLAACGNELPPLPDRGQTPDQGVVDQSQPTDTTVDAPVRRDVGPGPDMPPPPLDGGEPLDLTQPADQAPPADLPRPVDSTVDQALPVDLGAPDLPVPSLTVVLAPLVSPIGWYDAQGQSTIVIQSPAPTAGLTFECRLARPADIAGAVWGPCDGGTGSTAVVKPRPPYSNASSGTFVIEVRARWGNTTGSVVSRTFYAHSTLNGVPLCTPGLTDDGYFTMARQFLAASSRTFTTSSTYTNLSGPFIKFRVTPTGSTVSQQIDILSLRRRFSIDNVRKLILITRRFQSQRWGSCVPGIRMDTIWPEYQATYNRWLYRRRDFNCEAVVVNADGAGICFIRDSDGNLTTVKDLPSPYVMPKAYKILVDHIDRVPFSRKSRTTPTPQHYIYLPD